MTGLNQKYILCVFVVFFTTAFIKSLCVLEEKAVLSFKESSQSVGLVGLVCISFSFIHQQVQKVCS